MTSQEADALKFGDPIWVWHKNDWLKAKFVRKRTDLYPYAADVDFEETGWPDDTVPITHVELRKHGQAKPSS